MPAVHIRVLDAALSLADRRAGWVFRLRDIVAALPELHPPTIRTHVTSRCCVNAPSNHQSRYAYFRAVERGIYAVEPPFRRRVRGGRTRGGRGGWQDALLSRIDSGVDATLITESLRLTPTERLERMRSAARSIDAMRG